MRVSACACVNYCTRARQYIVRISVRYYYGNCARVTHNISYPRNAFTRCVVIIIVITCNDIAAGCAYSRAYSSKPTRPCAWTRFAGQPGHRLGSVDAARVPQHDASTRDLYGFTFPGRRVMPTNQNLLPRMYLLLRRSRSRIALRTRARRTITRPTVDFIFRFV